MDSHRRHQLRENALANWLITQYEEWIHPNNNWLYWGIIGVLIAALVIVGTLRLNAWSRSAAWKQYYAALHSGQAEADLESLADQTSGDVGIHARLALAQLKLAEGCNDVFTDKAKAVAALEKAVFVFQKVQKSAADKTIVQQAAFGLAQSWEALAASRNGGDLQKAEEEYSKIAELWKDTYFGKRAAAQLAVLKQTGTKKFFELAAVQVIKVEEKADDFKVNIDKQEPFAAGPGQFDAQKALDGEKPAEKLVEKPAEAEKK
ncbi:MAG: hypothetical protein LBT89_12735 [Planctomycetaceae bacterium]|jgi:tetratricopeptide (TPR) repeat protein|nr:hypothetical protein [Planctomycetaceae bacterium]